MDRRKVQKTGGSTYIVSLPKEWAEGKVEEGDSLLIEGSEESLRIYLEEKSEKRKEVTLHYEEPLKALLRKIIAHYLVGYDEIKIKSEDVLRRKKEIEGLVREKMMGLEVTGESSKEIMLQNLLKYSDLPTRKLLFRMNFILKNMYEDVIDSLENGKEDILRDVIKRENEIDRLYLLGVRQLKSAIRDDRIRKKLSLDSKLLCLGYRIVLKSMERVGDHLKKISSLLLDLDSEIPEREQLIQGGEKTLKNYEKIMESLLRRDGKLAEKSIQRSKEIDKIFKDLNKKEESRKKYFALKTIMNSIDRIRKLSRDIAEIVINLSAGDTE